MFPLLTGLRSYIVSLDPALDRFIKVNDVIFVRSLVCGEHQVKPYIHRPSTPPHTPTEDETA